MERPTLRDYFAGQALAGAIASSPPGSRYSENDVAKQCYIIADAMVAASTQAETAQAETETVE